MPRITLAQLKTLASSNTRRSMATSQSINAALCWTISPRPCRANSTACTWMLAPAKAYTSPDRL